MPSDGGAIAADVLISQEFMRRLRERQANKHFWSLEAENLALRQDIDQLLAQYNQLVAQYNALYEYKETLKADVKKLQDLCESWQTDYQRLRAWADHVETHGHPGGKK